MTQPFPLKGAVFLEHSWVPFPAELSGGNKHDTIDRIQIEGLDPRHIAVLDPEQKKGLHSLKLTAKRPWK